MSGPPRRPGPAAGPARAPGPERARTATVALRGVAAAYPNRPGLMIRDLDLELAPGRLVALAGPSGSGKTLAVLALLRFLDLTAGQLSIDGTDARARSPEEVRALLAWSPEQPTLFPASLRANLCVGTPHAADRQITDLLQQFRLGPWLDRLEQGLGTVLAPWDHPVSGGELQRLSVARAVLAGRHPDGHRAEVRGRQAAQDRDHRLTTRIPRAPGRPRTPGARGARPGTAWVLNRRQ